MKKELFDVSQHEVFYYLDQFMRGNILRSLVMKCDNGLCELCFSYTPEKGIEDAVAESK